MPVERRTRRTDWEYLLVSPLKMAINPNLTTVMRITVWAGPVPALKNKADRVTPPARWRLGAGVGLCGAEGTAGYFFPGLGAALAVADVVIPSAIALIVLTAVLWGSDKTCDRVFRLLRWIANRPEPPAPQSG